MITKYKITKAIAESQRTEVEINKISQEIKSKGFTYRALARNKQDKKIYQETKKIYVAKLDKISELCDKLKEQIEHIEEIDARSKKLERLESERDPETGFTKRSSMSDQEKRPQLHDKTFEKRVR